MLLKVISTGSQAGNCYTLKDDNDNIYLLDFGCDRKKILSGIDFQFANVRAAFLTHMHGDHSKSYEWLLKNGVHIYTNPETAQALSPNSQFMHGIKEKHPIKIYGCIATPFYVPHTSRDSETGKIIPCPNFGYLIKSGDETFLYATDYEYIPYTFKNQRINYMLLECNHMDDSLERDSAKYEHVLKGHSSVSTVRDIILANKTPDLRNVILCHLSSENADPDRMKSEIQQVSGKWVAVDIAEKGKAFELSRFPF